MRYALFTFMILIMASTFQGANAERVSKTATICYSGDPFRTDRAMDRCTDFCEDNDYGIAVGWMCGSDIKCGNSQCQCVCKKRIREEDRELQRRDDSGSIKIPLGDKLQLEIR